MSIRSILQPKALLIIRVGIGIVGRIVHILSFILIIRIIAAATRLGQSGSVDLVNSELTFYMAAYICAVTAANLTTFIQNKFDDSDTKKVLNSSASENLERPLRWHQIRQSVKSNKHEIKTLESVALVIVLVSFMHFLSWKIGLVFIAVVFTYAFFNIYYSNVVEAAQNNFRVQRIDFDRNAQQENAANISDVFFSFQNTKTKINSLFSLLQISFVIILIYIIVGPPAAHQQLDAEMVIVIAIVIRFSFIYAEETASGIARWRIAKLAMAQQKQKQ